MSIYKLYIFERHYSKVSLIFDFRKTNHRRGAFIHLT